MDERGNILYRAAGGLMGTANGNLVQYSDGTQANIDASVISDRLHRFAMADPEEMSRRVQAEVAKERRGQR